MPRSKRLIAWAGILLQGYAIYCMWSGSLTAVAFNGTGGDNEFYSTAPGNNWTDAYADTYEYGYSYNPTGRVTTRKMGVKATSYNTYNIYDTYNNIGFTATYQWDDEGRMTSLQYPTVTAAGSFGNMPQPMPIAAYQYDVNGRLSGMTMDDLNGAGPQPFASATYTAAGQLHTLSSNNGNWTETRTYNSLGQLTSQVVPYALNMTYNYSATGQNNRRITKLAQPRDNGLC